MPFSQERQIECDQKPHFHSLRIQSKPDSIHYTPEEREDKNKSKEILISTDVMDRFGDVTTAMLVSLHMLILLEFNSILMQNCVLFLAQKQGHVC